ncbi:Ankyrin repeat protein [Legionella sainthelensi]|uniref:Ankyrin repeat protein n=1 Tax=Legionella sainthelensi TaxID=28087 RepID=A0A0W0YS42_9GAMM|nr:DUF5630 domain-containing protein [Legionella sainthelensi]KTD59708.1 Ankyrin repeat protein [Legionella sainthelensi]VEH35718.1 Ankyrin repeat protein [Legionella sainthelensi]
MTNNQTVTLLLLKTQLENFVEDPNELNREDILSRLNTLKLTELNEFCQQHPTIRKILALSEFDAFWKTQREAIRVKNLPQFRFRNSPRLSDMDITLGYLNYYLSLKYPEDKSHYLQRAIFFHSYHAFKVYAHDCFMKMSSKEEGAFFDLLSLLPSFEKEAAWLGTPAYLITANLYFKAALHLVKKDKALEASAAFQFVIKYLCLADRIESESENDIHNAYFSQGLAQSNPFKLSTIREMIQACIQSAGKYLDQNTIDIAMSSAKLTPISSNEESLKAEETISIIQQTILKDAPELIQLTLSSEDSGGKTSQLNDSHLLFAVRHGKINSVRYLLSIGLSPKAMDEDQNTALHLAAITKNRGIYRLLQTVSSELINVKNVFQMTPIDILSETNQLSFFSTQEQLQSKLETAISTGAMEELDNCLQLGASPDVILSSGISPLSHMLKELNITGIQLLQNSGASLELEDAKGETPVFYLLKKGCSFEERKNRHIYFRHLQNLGINVNHQNSEGETLLIQAVRRDDYESVLFLLEQPEINIKITDIHGLNAMDYAKKALDSKIAHYFDLIGFNKDSEEVQANILSSQLMNKELRFFKTPGAAPATLGVENYPSLR